MLELLRPSPSLLRNSFIPLHSSPALLPVPTASLPLLPEVAGSDRGPPAPLPIVGADPKWLSAALRSVVAKDSLDLVRIGLPFSWLQQDHMFYVSKTTASSFQSNLLQQEVCKAKSLITLPSFLQQGGWIKGVVGVRELCSFSC